MAAEQLGEELSEQRRDLCALGSMYRYLPNGTFVRVVWVDGVETYEPVDQ